MKTKTNKPLKIDVKTQRSSSKSSEGNSFQTDTTFQHPAFNSTKCFNKLENDSCIIVHTTKKIRCIFNSGAHSTLKSDTWGKTQTTNSYRPQFHVNRFDPKRDLHEFTCNILNFIQLRATQYSWNSLAKTVSTFTNINTLTFLTSHTTEFFLFLTDTTTQATIHAQPCSFNIFV